MPKKPIKRKSASGAGKPKTVAETVAEAWNNSRPGKGRHASVVKALRKQGFEVIHSVNGIDIRQSGRRRQYFTWPRKRA